MDKHLTLSAGLVPLSAGLALIVATVGGAAAGPCRGAAAEGFVGKGFPGEAQLQTATGASLVRRIAPGDPVTMDFNENRLTVEVDAAGRIVRASCG